MTKDGEMRSGVLKSISLRTKSVYLASSDLKASRATQFIRLDTCK